MAATDSPRTPLQRAEQQMFKALKRRYKEWRKENPLGLIPFGEHGCMETKARYEAAVAIIHWLDLKEKKHGRR